MTTEPTSPKDPATVATPRRPRPRHLDALAEALRRATPTPSAVDHSRDTLGRLLIEGPLAAPSTEPCAATVLRADAWDQDGRGPEPGAPARTLAAEMDPWPDGAGDRPLLPLLAWSLQDEGEEMELVLAGLEAGRRLTTLGASILLGPPLRPGAWRGTAELTALASASFLHGLQAAGVTAIVDGFPAASDADLASELRAFPHAFAHGVDAVRLDVADADAAAEACRALRDGLGFIGVIVGRTAVPGDVPDWIAAGCDAVQTTDPTAALDALTDGADRLPPRRLRDALARTSVFFTPA
ncbi:MAG: hypothetical protein AAFY88_22005 [Acidobacteriota bacterium]